MVLVSVVAPSVGGGVIESVLVVSAGSRPVRGVPPAATEAGAGARIGPGSPPAGATADARFPDLVVLAAGAAAPARKSAVSFPAAGDDPAEDVTTVSVEVEIAAVVCTLVELVSLAGESVTASPPALADADWTLSAGGAAMSERVPPPALSSAGLVLLIGAALLTGAEPVAGVAVGAGAAVGAGEAAEAAGTGAAAEAGPLVSVGGGFELDDELVVCPAALEDESVLAGCGAGLLTVAPAFVDEAASVVVDEAVSAVVVEVASVVVDAWSAGTGAAGAAAALVGAVVVL